MSEPVSRIIKITNKRGLHARASAKFVKCVDDYDVEIRVSKDGHTVGGSSIMGLMMLGASKDTNIHITATGKDADAAIAALELLLNEKFGEAE